MVWLKSFKYYVLRDLYILHLYNPIQWSLGYFVFLGGRNLVATFFFHAGRLTVLHRPSLQDISFVRWNLINMFKITTTRSRLNWKRQCYLLCKVSVCNFFGWIMISMMVVQSPILLNKCLIWYDIRNKYIKWNCIYTAKRCLVWETMTSCFSVVCGVSCEFLFQLVFTLVLTTIKMIYPI